MARVPSFEPAPADGVVALRRWRREDVPAIAAACRDPEIRRWTLVPDDYDEVKAREYVAGTSTRWWSGAALEVAVVAADDPDRLLGSVGLVRLDREQAYGEIGYWVAPDARRRGVAVRAVRLLSEWAFEQLGLTRIELMPYVGNTASARVAERAAYTYERVQPATSIHGSREVLLFSLTPA